MAPKPSLPQHHRTCLFMLFVCPSSSYHCPFSSNKGLLFLSLPSHQLFLWMFLGRTGVTEAPFHTVCYRVCHWFALNPLLISATSSWPYSQPALSGASKNRWKGKGFSMFPKWCLVCMSWISHHVWWCVNFSCTHFHQVDGMDVSSFSCFQNGLGLWNTTGKSSSLQGWYFLVSMEWN